MIRILREHWRLSSVTGLAAAAIVGGCLAPPTPITRAEVSAGAQPVALQDIAGLSAPDVHSPGPRSADFSDPEGEGITRRVTSTASADGRWNVELFRVAPDGELTAIERVVFRARPPLGDGERYGTVMLEEVWDFVENRVTRFDPPLEFFPGELAAGTTHTHETRIAIAGLDDPSDIDQTGSGSIEATFVGVTPIELDGGVEEALELRSVLRFGIGPARVTRTTESWFLAPPDLHAERSNLKVKVGPLTIKNEWTASVAMD